VRWKGCVLFFVKRCTFLPNEKIEMMQREQRMRRNREQKPARSKKKENESARNCCIARKAGIVEAS